MTTAQTASAQAGCHVVGPEGTEAIRFDADSARRLLEGEGCFWVDLYRPGEADFAVLRDVFGFHPLAVEDSEHRKQRAKIDDYDDFIFIVAFGAAPPGAEDLTEVHCFYTGRFLVTVRRDEIPAFDELRRRYGQPGALGDNPSVLLYRIIDGLVDSFFPSLARFDDRIDELENAIFLRPDEEQLQEIFRMKRLLVATRKAVTPQRDAFAGLANGLTNLPGLNKGDDRYFRDVYDHLIRISDLIDSYRDLLTGAMDVYLSTVSNRLNSVMKQLTIIATIFLPLSWLTGFFGQNFSWLVEQIGSWQTFVIVGIGTELIAVVLLLLFFRRRGWF